MRKLPLLTLVFSISFSVFILGPVLLGQQFTPYPLMKNGDVFDFFTPQVLIPLYWLIFWTVLNKTPNVKAIILFLIFAALWVEGQGIHLGANSIGHWLNNMKGTDTYNVAYLYDEVLGHYFWHAGMIGLSALIMFQEWRNQATNELIQLWPPVAAGLLHGFTFFLLAVEGQTTLMGVPFAVGVTVYTLIFGRNRVKKQSFLLFFFVAFLLATMLFAGWGFYWGGFPEFSEVWGI